MKAQSVIMVVGDFNAYKGSHYAEKHNGFVKELDVQKSTKVTV